MSFVQPLEPPLAPIALAELGIAPGMVVADFGAGGSAAWAIAMSSMVGPDGQVVMFDVRKAALTAALNMAKLKGLTNCRGVWSNLEIFGGAQGIANDSLDAGVMITLLNETRHPKDVLAEIHRMLKPGAKMLIVDWDVDTSHRLAPARERRLAPEYIESLGKQLGFVSVQRLQPSPSYWGLILAKT